MTLQADPRLAAFLAPFREAHPGAPEPVAAFAFDDNAAGAAACAASVLDGTKTATSQLAADPAPTIGTLEIVTERDGTPRAIIRILACDTLPFGAVDEAFARAEGDGTLAAWRATHLRCYGDRLAARGGRLTEATLLRRIFFTRVWPTGG